MDDKTRENKFIVWTCSKITNRYNETSRTNHRNIGKSKNITLEVIQGDSKILDTTSGITLQTTQWSVKIR